MTFRQVDVIRNYVFPIAPTEPTEEGPWKLISLLGTGFLIGNRGVALTAAHVVKDTTTGLAALFVGDEGWEALAVALVEQHPGEDVAVVGLDGGGWNEPCPSACTPTCEWS